MIYLTNFWEWSGGMMTYLYWTNGGRYINMNDPAHPWPEFPDMSLANSTRSAPAVAHVPRLCPRGGRADATASPARRYADDPAIMAWQLANEPRPGGSDEVGLARTCRPIWPGSTRTARLIKSLDPNHLVSTGSEGTQGCIDERRMRGRRARHRPTIDYMTAHIWPQNWSWADPKDLAGTWPTVEKQHARLYRRSRSRSPQRLGKPLVIEEFGFPRDGGSFDPGSATTFKDRFYALIYRRGARQHCARAARLRERNFWAWGGEGRAQHADHHFVRGDTSLRRRPAARAAGLVQRVRQRCVDAGGDPQPRGCTD